MSLVAKLDLPVVAIRGRLRIVDPPRRSCWGYAVGCMCKECLVRERGLQRAGRAPRQPWEVA